jgi:hypothetical protein
LDCKLTFAQISFPVTSRFPFWMSFTTSRLHCYASAQLHSWSSVASPLHSPAVRSCNAFPCFPPIADPHAYVSPITHRVFLLKKTPWYLVVGAQKAVETKCWVEKLQPDSMTLMAWPTTELDCLKEFPVTGMHGMQLLREWGLEQV